MAKLDGFISNQVSKAFRSVLVVLNCLGTLLAWLSEIKPAIVDKVASAVFALVPIKLLNLLNQHIVFVKHNSDIPPALQDIGVDLVTLQKCSLWRSGCVMYLVRAIYNEFGDQVADVVPAWGTKLLSDVDLQIFGASDIHLRDEVSFTLYWAGALRCSSLDEARTFATGQLHFESRNPVSSGDCCNGSTVPLISPMAAGKSVVLAAIPMGQRPAVTNARPSPCASLTSLYSFCVSTSKGVTLSAPALERMLVGLQVIAPELFNDGRILGNAIDGSIGDKGFFSGRDGWSKFRIPFASSDRNLQLFHTAPLCESIAFTGTVTKVGDA